MSYAVVIPTVGRPSLAVLLARLVGVLERAHPVRHSRPAIVVVDDRATPTPALPTGFPIRVLPSGGRGPAAARNVGWQAVNTEWVAFLDDDVLPDADWGQRIVADLQGLAPDVAASQGRLVVPLPTARRPNDAERGTANLAGGRWITADIAYRRVALQRVGGFDERFRRAYREDSDLALRVLAAGYRIVNGQRRTFHPVRAAGPLASVRAQRGNFDDALMRQRHGPGWRARIGGDPGRLAQHALTTIAAVTALAAAAGRHAPLAGASGLVWAGFTTQFAAHRILEGPRDPAEIARMVGTSVAIPPLACWYRLAGEVRWRRVPRATPVPAAVLFDRDGTLIHDVPYNADPAAVRPVPGARQALNRLREAGIPVGVITNQSGVARGLISAEQLEQVNNRVSELLGPFAVWRVCPHDRHDGCGCRKPAPGLVTSAAAQLGVPAQRCVVIGDIGADMEAAEATGARGILVPTHRTLRREIRAAPHVATSLAAAVELALTGRAS
jgi:HAD superfamily hydrolase (TIGR01662 family)